MRMSVFCFVLGEGGILGVNVFEINKEHIRNLPFYVIFCGCSFLCFGFVFQLIFTRLIDHYLVPRS